MFTRGMEQQQEKQSLEADSMLGDYSGGRICKVGQNHIYIPCTYGIFGREITKYTVIYGVYIQFWPTLQLCHVRFAYKRCVTYKQLYEFIRVNFMHMTSEERHSPAAGASLGPTLRHLQTALRIHTCQFYAHDIRRTTLTRSRCFIRSHAASLTNSFMNSYMSILCT